MAAAFEGLPRNQSSTSDQALEVKVKVKMLTYTSRLFIEKRDTVWIFKIPIQISFFFFLTSSVLPTREEKTGKNDFQLTGLLELMIQIL